MADELATGAAEHQIARLVLAAERDYLAASLAFLREVAQPLGLVADDLVALERAVQEVCLNVIEHGFEPGQPGRFDARPDASTLVRVSLQYNPPGGELAHMLSALFGEDPGARIEEDLMRLKEAMGRAHEDRDGIQPASANALGYQPKSPGGTFR